jgi:hypothetical protein
MVVAHWYIMGVFALPLKQVKLKALLLFSLEELPCVKGHYPVKIWCLTTPKTI